MTAARPSERKFRDGVGHILTASRDGPIISSPKASGGLRRAVSRILNHVSKNRIRTSAPLGSRKAPARLDTRVGATQGYGFSFAPVAPGNGRALERPRKWPLFSWTLTRP